MFEEMETEGSKLQQYGFEVSLPSWDRSGIPRKGMGALGEEEIVRLLGESVEAQDRELDRIIGERRSALAREMEEVETHERFSWVMRFMEPLLANVRNLHRESTELLWNLWMQSSFWKTWADTQTDVLLGNDERTIASRLREFGEGFVRRVHELREKEHSTAEREMLDGIILAYRSFEEGFLETVSGERRVASLVRTEASADEMMRWFVAHERVEGHDLNEAARGIGQLNLVIRSTLNLVLGVTVLAMLVGAMGFYRYTRSFRRRLEGLIKGIGKMAGGDLEVRLESREDELGVVAKSLNKMAFDLKELQAQLIHSEKLASIGTLAGGVAHEFNNLLGSVVIEVESALLYEDKATMKSALSEIQKSADAAAVIVRNLLNFSKKLKPDRKRLPLDQVVEDALQLVRRDLGNRKVRVHKELSPDVQVYADPGQLQQVFVNLFANARDAMPQGGILTVRSEQGQGGGMARISVSDTGNGIPPGDRERLFEPFYTTKGGHGAGATPGTGLGLYVSREIVRSHGGDLRLEESGSGGTRFVVEIPTGAGIERGAENRMSETLREIGKNTGRGGS
jgi:signal transduction histidine kinase